MTQTPPIEPSKDESEQEKNSNTEKFQFIIALIIIVPFMAYVGIFHASNMTDEAKDILTMLGVFVGTIVGFYFGQKPVQSLTRQVVNANTEVEKTKNNLSESYGIAEVDVSLMRNLSDQLQIRDQIIENLKSKIEEQ